MVGGGATVRVVDPQGQREGEVLLPGVVWHNDPYAAADKADLVVILTEWNEFRALDLEKLAGGMANRRFADLRNIYTKEDVIRAGFDKYDCVGR
jgi:UDPglucose 6-dehydrogenase